MSSVFDHLVDLLRENGVTLLLGTTLLLAMFALLVRCSRSLSTKNLLASTAMLAVFGYLVVAIVPMPRFGIDLRGAMPPGTTEQTPSNQSAPPAPKLSPIASNELMFAALQHVDEEQPNAASQAHVTPPAMPSRGERMASSLRIPDPQQPAASTFDLSTWLAGAFAIGAALFALHLCIGWLHLRRLLANSQRASAELTGLVKLPARTRLRIVNAAVQPFCCGLLRPTIVLPQKLAHPTDETRFILLHERAHLTSGDTRARLLAALLRPLLFWHPLYWWLQHKLRFTSELLADDAAAQGSVADYVRCMMTLSTHPDPATGGALVATIFRRRSELFRRLEMMLQRDEAISRSHSPLSRWTRAASTLLLITLCAGTFGVEDAVAQSPRQDQVRNQVRELKAELDRLRLEVSALRESEKNSPFRNVRFGRLNLDTNELEALPAPPADPAAPSTPGNLGLSLPLDPARAPTAAAQAPIAPPRAETERRTLYKVKAGDSLAKIAQEHMGSSRAVPEILRHNPDIEPNRLRVGQQLTIPVRTPHIGPQARKNDQILWPRRLPGSPRSNEVRSALNSIQRHPAAPRAPERNSRAPRPVRSVNGTRLPTARRMGHGTGVSSAASPTPPSPAVAGFPGALPATAATSRSLTSSPRSNNATRQAPTASLSGLADVVTRCIELRGDVEIQEVNVRHATSEKEREIAKIRLRTKKSQFKAIESMLKLELQAAEQAHMRSKKLHERGFVTTAEVQATESKIQMLTRALK